MQTVCTPQKCIEELSATSGYFHQKQGKLFLVTSPELDRALQKLKILVVAAIRHY
ncbi:MAG: hypothetical protein ACP8RL_05985 [cyanobacterium endosymbiont of Rhopalodia inflata]